MKKTLFIFSLLSILPLWGMPQNSSRGKYEEYILTPRPPASPHINGPRVYGLRPGSPLIYRIPCTGKRPIKFTAEDLPRGIVLDEKTGIMTGKVVKAGSYDIVLNAENTYGSDERRFTLKVGDKLALTPPMGWNSWYIHYDRISEKTMREAADQMIASGMADFGYQYVNIDDCWMRKVNSDDPLTGGKCRDQNGVIIPNGRFPDIAGMVEYIHAKGLKAGTYISPGPRTCAGYEGSYKHEALDAKTFARWGFDFLKYDWCSYRKVAGSKSDPDYYIRPYRLMWNELQKQDRDIVLNLCQYGMGNVWEWGAQVGNCWRTTGDLGLEESKNLPGFYTIGFSNAKHAQYAGPGGWNDPDYILIGWVGAARGMGEGKPTDLTPWEQYSYMSMWSLMAAPLIFSGDMAKLDKFTLNVLCNHEVIEVNQDPLGKQAVMLKKSDSKFIMVKPMADGSLAVGLFNLKPEKQEISVLWKELGISGVKRVRDLWRQKDMAGVSGQFTTVVQPHGVAFIRIFDE